MDGLYLADDDLRWAAVQCALEASVAFYFQRFTYVQSKLTKALRKETTNKEKHVTLK